MIISAWHGQCRLRTRRGCAAAGADADAGDHVDANDHAGADSSGADLEGEALKLQRIHLFSKRC